MIAPWRQRSIEERALFNPALLAAVVHQAAAGYYAEKGAGLPFPLAFLAAAVVLHRPSRSALPTSVRTTLAAWLADHPDSRVGLLERARGIAPLLREGMLFGSKRSRPHDAA